MKTKLYALLASAALIAQVQAGGNHIGGVATFSAPRGPPPPAAAAPSFYSGSVRNFGGGLMMYSGRRFSSVGWRSPSATTFRPRYLSSGGSAMIANRQLTPGNIDRGNRLARSSIDITGCQLTISN